MLSVDRAFCFDKKEAHHVHIAHTGTESRANQLLIVTVILMLSQSKYNPLRGRKRPWLAFCKRIHCGMLKTFLPEWREKQKQGRRVDTIQKAEISDDITQISSHYKSNFLLQAFTTGNYKFNYTKTKLTRNSTNIKTHN